jgi:hypothetical protein
MEVCFTVVFFIIGLLTGTADSANLGCQHVKFAFTTKGLNANDVPSTPQNGKWTS